MPRGGGQGGTGGTEVTYCQVSLSSALGLNDPMAFTKSSNFIPGE